jgi:arginyl-tRNA--protein-N-Asp/Glu arginylyltransferase
MACCALGLPYVYLGYWIEGSAKMAYKARFRPFDRLLDGAWLPHDQGPAMAVHGG